MPRKNTIRQLGQGSYYHVFNRGVAKQETFLDAHDYRVFMGILVRLISTNDSGSGTVHATHGYLGEISINAFCLMPNHFHLMVRQDSQDSLPGFMRSLSQIYTKQFNKRHGRQGRLFERNYRAVLQTDPSQFAHLSRYIHLNPVKLAKDLEAYEFSSYRYLSKPPPWLDIEPALTDMDVNQYKKFVAEFKAAA